MKQILLILLLLCSSLMFSQSIPFFFKQGYPEYVPCGTNFQVSTVIRVDDPSIEGMRLILLTDDMTDIESVKILDKYSSSEIESIANEDDYTGKTSVYIIPDSLIKSQMPFQIITDYRCGGRDIAELNYGVRIFNRDGTERIFTSYDSFSGEKVFDPVIIAGYKTVESAGSCLNLIESESVVISVPDGILGKSLLIEFWAKFYDSSGNFISYQSETGDTLLSLGLNDFRMISISGVGDINRLDNFFISPASWQHFSILLSPDERKNFVFINDRLVFEEEITGLLIPGRKEIRITGAGKKGLEIDLLRFWDYGNAPSLSFRNKHYNHYNADSSKLLFYENFDNPHNLRSNFIPGKVNLSLQSEYETRLSDAPLFTRAPELNISVYLGIYSIEWKNRDPDQAEEFILEKSRDGGDFIPIYRTYADKEADETYYFTDMKNSEEDMVYYRIKQINKDSTYIFSDRIKVGQGEIEPFELEQNYPNPFNPTTTITVEMLETLEVEIKIYDVVGKEIAELHSGALPKGIHEFSFNGAGLPSGIYFCEIKSESSSVARKMILAK